MTVTQVLKRAQALIAGGWTNRHVLEKCERQEGSDIFGKPAFTQCEHDDEGVELFSVEGALRASTKDQLELREAFDVLEQVHHPTLFALEEFAARMPKEPAAISDELLRAYLQLMKAAEKANEMDLDRWLARPWRRLTEVLRLFDLAIQRASTREAA